MATVHKHLHQQVKHRAFSSDDLCLGPFLECGHHLQLSVRTISKQRLHAQGTTTPFPLSHFNYHSENSTGTLHDSDPPAAAHKHFDGPLATVGVLPCQQRAKAGGNAGRYWAWCLHGVQYQLLGPDCSLRREGQQAPQTQDAVPPVQRVTRTIMCF